MSVRTVHSVHCEQCGRCNHYIHPSIHPSIHSFTHPRTRSCVRACVHSVLTYAEFKRSLGPEGFNLNLSHSEQNDLAVACGESVRFVAMVVVHIPVHTHIHSYIPTYSTSTCLVVTSYLAAATVCVAINGYLPEYVVQRSRGVVDQLSLVLVHHTDYQSYISTTASANTNTMHIR